MFFLSYTYILRAVFLLLYMSSLLHYVLMCLGVFVSHNVLFVHFICDWQSIVLLFSHCCFMRNKLLA